MMIVRDNAQLTFSQTIMFTYGTAGSLSMTTTGSSQAPPVLTTPNSSDAFNGEAPVAPLVPVYGRYANPMISVGRYGSGDLATRATFTATVYGTSRTFLTIGLLASSGAWSVGNLSNGTNRYYMIYE
jgi:hypothetical protein